MRNILLFSLFIATFIILNSCKDIRRKEGDWDDCINLSTKSVEFSPLKDSVVIKTGGAFWWITDVSVNNEHFFNFKEINQSADYYIIKQDVFIVERRDKHTLFIKVEENPLNINRIITVGLQAGDYFDRVIITQKTK